jgi:hypothetical protein
LPRHHRRGGAECSTIAPEPYFGADEADLIDCTDEGFDLITYVEFTFNGTTTTDLGAYVVQTNVDTLPPDNLLGPDAGFTMDKGYFLVVGPLAPGEHTMRAYDEFESVGFQAGITYTIVVD